MDDDATEESFHARLSANAQTPLFLLRSVIFLTSFLLDLSHYSLKEELLVNLLGFS